MKALTAALLLSSSAIAQLQISGKVQNDYGEALQGVTVSIKGKNTGTISKSGGQYTIKNLKSGTYDVRASFFGYETLTKTIVLEENQVINFSLNSTFFMQEGIDVRAVRANKKTPTTYTNISAEDIEKQNYGQDLPYLLESMPATVVTSDAGAGIGYTSFRIRGVDPTRTNVTVDGIPMNDGESQGVFWVNMPDFSSSVESMQVQRGVGTSSNGGGAFGASINIATNKLQQKPYAVIDNSGGSFNSIRNSVNVGTGMINNKFTVDARLSRIKSDGYIDRASADLKSYFLSGAYHGKKSTLRLNIFSGKEKTYQAWYGTPESRVNGDEQEMIAYAGRNGLSDSDVENLLNSGRTYNAYTYENETDNYQQDHYQLHYAYQLSKNWNMKAAAHYTRGLGYYENYETDDKFSKYGYAPIVVNGDSIDRMDLIRRRWLDNHFGGGIFNFNYKGNKGLELVLGGGINKYVGDHFGDVIWAEYMPDNQKGDKYYDNTSTKYDGNLYAKATYQWKKFTFFADAQYRHIDYQFEGIDEVSGQIINLDQRVFYNFMNPKAGLSYRFNGNHSVYASYAIANREPVRKDFREKTIANRPEHEVLYNLEAGYRLTHKKAFLNANIYHMLYENQLVLTGEINDVGGYTRTNVDESYRLGLEIEGGYQVYEKLGITGNLALSQNKIENFTEYVDSYDASFNTIPQEVIEYGTTDLAFSPSIIAGLSLNYAPVKGVRVSLINKYVGKQYLDNTSEDSRALDAYFVSHLDLSYSFKSLGFEEITVGGRINNLFNEMYENNGYTFSYIVGGDRTQENFYYPQAGTNFMVRLLLKL
ncbi:TonB-dependent receptor [Brumimicrobium oceani]|uniref:TonB-dependent receptor n=2 Tax=Brumimicrobium oceani TaxID=2100725 RepID=A0A2U2XBQ1_9FLAO|nr:TonB-dependent receptor [Brumimicrobium oceani]